MKMFISFLKFKSGSLVLCLLLLAVFNSCLFLYNIEKEVFIYIDILAISIIIPYFLIAYWRYANHYKQVQNLAKDYENMSLDKQSGDIIEDTYLKIIEDLKKMLNENQRLETAKYHDIIDYYTVWVHQIKTPIAAMHLLLADKNEPDMAMELLRIEEYVEMVMSYLKTMENDDDYRFEKLDLDKVIKEEIKYYRTVFIQKKIRLIYDEVNYELVTDEKWLAFIIGQILSNALKYSKNNGEIKIYLETDTLYIQDRGIGIVKEDLPMIFDKGYSGKAGHKYKRASGIGLYLVKKYCEILDIDIHISSKVGEGTTVALHFNRRRRHYD